MEFDVLLMTRTMKEDYTWFYRPDYVDHSVNLLIRPLLMTVENQKNREIFEQHGSHNCFFMIERNYCMLVYLYFTDRSDSSGRRIYALEGLVCEKKDSRMFWKLLPFLIQEIYGCTLEEQYGLYDENVVSPSTRTISMDWLKEYLLKGTEELLEEFREYDDSFLNMLEETGKSAKMYSFVYGNQTDIFAFAGFERFYQWGEAKKQYTADEITFAGPAEEESVRSFLFFEKQEQGFQAGGGLTDQAGRVLAEWKEYLPVPKEGIGMLELADLEVQMEDLADFYGYRPDWRIEERKTVPRRFHLQWLVIPVPRMRISVQRFAGKLDGLEGCMDEYRVQDERLFLQLYQYARRIREPFFSRSEGRETLYLLTRPSGLWMFAFLKESDGYWMRGIRIRKQEQKRAWLFLDQILEEYLLPDTSAYTGEFGEILSSFCAEAREMLLPSSFILSVFPEENFPALKNTSVRTGPGTARTFRKIMYRGEAPVNDGRDRRSCDGTGRLCPPARFGRKWRIFKPSVKGEEEIKLTCISAEEGSVYQCDAETFFTEANFLQ